MSKERPRGPSDLRPMTACLECGGPLDGAFEVPDASYPSGRTMVLPCGHNLPVAKVTLEYVSDEETT